jgi:hypothetical protein
VGVDEAGDRDRCAGIQHLDAWGATRSVPTAATIPSRTRMSPPWTTPISGSSDTTSLRGSAGSGGRCSWCVLSWRCATTMAAGGCGLLARVGRTRQEIGKTPRRCAHVRIRAVLHYRLLGPLAVERGDASLDLGPPKQRALLTVLAQGAGAMVSTDRILASVWGDALRPASSPACTPTSPASGGCCATARPRPRRSSGGPAATCSTSTGPRWTSRRSASGRTPPGPRSAGVTGQPRSRRQKVRSGS